MRQIQDVFTNVLKAKRVVTFADTCHSFGFSGARRGSKKDANNLVINIWRITRMTRIAR